MNDQYAVHRLNIRSELVFKGTDRPFPIPDGYVMYWDERGVRCLIASDIFEAAVAAGTWPPGRSYQ